MRSSHLLCGSVNLCALRSRCDRAVDSLGVRHERRAERELADVADDGGGDVLVLLLAPRRLHDVLAEALLVEGELELAKVLAREVARALRHDEQRGELVQVARRRTPGSLEVVARAAAPVLAVAARDLAQLVGVLGDDHLVRRRSRRRGRGTRASAGWLVR